MTRPTIMQSPHVRDPRGLTLLEVLVALLLIGVFLPMLLNARVQERLNGRMTRVQVLVRDRGRQIVDELRGSTCSELRVQFGARMVRGSKAIRPSMLSDVVDQYREDVSITAGIGSVTAKVILTYRVKGTRAERTVEMEEEFLCTDDGLVLR